MKIKYAMSHILSRSGVIAPVAAAEITVTNNSCNGTSSINISFEALQLQKSCGP